MNLLLNHPPSPISPLHSLLLEEKGIQLLVKRDDLLQLGDDLAFCGNKWRKLQYNLLEARKKGIEQLLTFGGAYSNHIVATASAGRLFGFSTIGIIRGEQYPALNPSLQYARDNGMKLHYLKRSSFRNIEEPAFIDRLRVQFGEFYLLPLGGTNDLAIKGCMELVAEVRAQLSGVLPDYFCLSCGTGGTLTGIVAGLDGTAKTLGFSVLKGDFLKHEVAEMLNDYCKKQYSNWDIHSDYHFGGFAKFPPDLIAFINGFKDEFQLPLDPVYTGKFFFGLFDLIGKGFFPKGSTVLAIHTGGLQGIIS